MAFIKKKHPVLRLDMLHPFTTSCSTCVSCLISCQSPVQSRFSDLPPSFLHAPTHSIHFMSHDRHDRMIRRHAFPDLEQGSFWENLCRSVWNGAGPPPQGLSSFRSAHQSKMLSTSLRQTKTRHTIIYRLSPPSGYARGLDNKFLRIQDSTCTVRDLITPWLCSQR